VKNRNGKPLGDVGTEPRRVAVARSRRKPDQIIDDDVHGTADVIAGQLRHIQRLGPNALAGEGRIAVHGDFHHLLAPLRPAPLLLGARAAHGNRIDRFQVAGIRNQMHLDLSVRWRRRNRLSRPCGISRRRRPGCSADRHPQSGQKPRPQSGPRCSPSRSAGRGGSSPKCPSRRRIRKRHSGWRREEEEARLRLREKSASCRDSATESSARKSPP
jgi:hypothetical protein